MEKAGSWEATGDCLCPTWLGEVSNSLCQHLLPLLLFLFHLAVVCHDSCTMTTKSIWFLYLPTGRRLQPRNGHTTDLLQWYSPHTGACQHWSYCWEKEAYREAPRCMRQHRSMTLQNDCAAGCRAVPGHDTCPLHECGGTDAASVHQMLWAQAPVNIWTPPSTSIDLSNTQTGSHTRGFWGAGADSTQPAWLYQSKYIK